jgi:hypothetical protein
VIGIEDDGRLAVPEQGGEALLALDIGEERQILALNLQRVEGEQGEPAPAVADRLLEAGEVGVALLVQPDDLAVEQRGADFELARPPRRSQGIVGPVQARARIDLRLRRRRSRAGQR